MSKNDSFWFKHDSNASRDLKLMKIRVIYDFWGIGIYWTIIEFLREQPNYKYEFSESNMQLLCEIISCKDAVKFDNFIKESIKLELLKIEGKYLLSSSLIERMMVWESKKSNGYKTKAKRIESEIEAKEEHKIREDKIREDKIREEKSNTPYDEIFLLYNQICGEKLSKLKNLSESRKKKVASRFKEIKNIEGFEDLFKKTINTPFLCGINERKWKADFDWLIDNDTNYIKVIEGKYGVIEVKKTSNIGSEW